MTAAATAVALAALTAFAGCATIEPDGSREVEVEAEGMAPADHSDLVTTERRAMADAQKKAVEKAIGVTVRASTRVDDDVNVRESIEANLGGTIRRYQVLSAGMDGDYYKVRIRAVVLYRPRAAPDQMKPTRFAVKLPDEKAAGALRSVLASYDYPVVDSENDADILITGVLDTYGRADLRLGGFYSYRASLELDVVDMRSGKVSEQKQEGSSVDVDEQAASDDAREEAGRNAAMAIITQLEGAEAFQARRY